MHPPRTTYDRSLGFTLLELAVVVAVTGVLGAVLVSAFRTHSVRTEVQAGIEQAARWEPVVERAFRAYGQAPADWRETDSAPRRFESAQSVESIQLVSGRLDIQYGNGADEVISGRRLSLVPYETASQEVVWVCGNAAPDLGLKPLGFAGGGRQSVHTSATIESRYLPRACR